MSLYSVAQAESSFILATNLDSSTTEQAVKTGLTASSTAYGTITQNASSLTGNASYDFGSDGRVLHQWSGSTSTQSFILEGVFKRSVAPASTVTLLSLPGSSSGSGRIQINSSGQVIGAFTNAFSQSLSLTSSANFCDGSFHHVVLAYSKGVGTTTVFRLYVDGTLVGSTTNSISESGWGYQRILNIGSTLSTAGTASAYFNGTIDFAAFYIQGTAATASDIDTFVANHAASFADESVTAPVATASALAVEPVVTTTKNVDYAAAPATASATADGHYQTDIDLPQLLEQYMQSLANESKLEQWWKFDTFNAINNYGNGGQSGIGYIGNSINLTQGGVQGSGCIGFTGSLFDGYIGGANAIGMPGFNTELSDGNYVMGFWTYIPSSITSTRAIFAASDSSGRYLGVSFNGTTATTTINSSSGTHTVTGTTTINNNRWHLLAVKFSGTTLELFINGTSQGTVTVNGTLPGTITSAGFGNNNVSSIGGDKILVSQFFIGTTTNIANGTLTNIYNAGKDQVQASAEIRMPAFKDDNAFNTKILELDPYFYWKLDEATGNPISVAEPATLAIEGPNYTQNVSTKNKKGIRLTNRDTVLGNAWTAPSGTFSSQNKQTLVVYAKPSSTGLVNPIASTGATNFGVAGIGLTLLVNAANQTLLRIFTSFVSAETITNTTANVTDGNYHLFTGVKDGSTLKLYIDGKLVNSQSSTATLTDIGQFLLGGNAAASTTNASRDVTVDEVAVFDAALTDSQIFDIWRSLTETMDTTASASLPMPTYQAGFGPTVAVDTMTASAALPNVFPFVSPATASGLFQVPNFEATKNTSQAAEPMTASAQAENPGWDIGENNQVLHMDASAAMGNARALIPGFWNANPFTVQAELPMPAIVTTLGALIKAQSLNANAFAPLPPAYFTIADDLWYQRLVAIDQKSPDVDGSIVFFNTSSDTYVGGTPIAGSGWTATASYNQITSPLPAANGGYFDGQNRKAINLRNINLTTGYTRGNLGLGDRDFTFEAMIKTTKSNQVLFAGENDNSYNFQRTGVVLRDGKLALTYSKDSRSGAVSASDQPLAFIGNKNIADGQWHHIIIQNRQTGVDQTQPRIQFWVDGELDIQRYGFEIYVINQIGYNSSDVNSYSDFTISAIGLNRSSMVEENEINLNYLAAINVIPVKAAVATASATATPNNKGRGNRGRALMLYFWPTQNAEIGIYRTPPARPTGLNTFGNNYHYYDQGGYGNDPDTFYQLPTYLTNGAQKFYDWDIWPISVIGLESGDTWTGESHPILKDGIFKSGTDKGTVYVDPVTDNERYLNLMTDLKDLDQFDMICFRNYPDQSGEQDKYGVNAKGVVDEYFNFLDKDLFADFLKSLRDAVDTGISLLITNPQLAVDMGFIDTYHTVSDLTGSGNEGLSDPYVPIKLNDPLGTGTQQLTIDYPTSLTGDGSDEYFDAYRNNYHQVVNTLEDLTDDAAFIWTDEIKYSQDQSEFGELDRWWSHVEYNDGLQVGDKFLFSTAPHYFQSYFATPLEAVRAGKVITKFADTYMYGTVERVNPYRNYATSIAVEPGTVVAGKQIGAKVFISFTDVVGVQQGGLGGRYETQAGPIEQKQVALKTDYWINYAYSVGLLTIEERDDLLAKSIDRGPASSTRDALAYWTLNGQDIIGTLAAYADNAELSADTSEQAKKQKVLKRTRRGKAKRTIGAGALPNFMILWGWSTKNISVPVPSINLRGLWWLSERLEYGDDLPQRPEAFNADAFMKQPVVTGYKTATIAAQPGLAVGAMNETNLRSANTTIAVLPLTATAFFVEKGTLVPAEAATANATLAQEIRTTTAESDQVVLYLVHVDPILYLREDVIK